jgi:hypothetical protein
MLHILSHRRTRLINPAPLKRFDNSVINNRHAACWSRSKLPFTDFVPFTPGKGSVCRKLRWAPRAYLRLMPEKKIPHFWELHPCPVARSQSLNWLIDSRKRRHRKIFHTSKNNHSVVDYMQILLRLSRHKSSLRNRLVRWKHKSSRMVRCVEG